MFGRFLAAARAAAAKRPPCPECGIKTAEVVSPDGEAITFRVLCEHEVPAVQEAEAKEQRRRDFDKYQSVYGRHMPAKTFQGIDLGKLEPGLGVNVARRYLETWDDRREKGEGLVLAGGVGTGKTTIAAAIAAELERDWWRVLFTTEAWYLRTMQSNLDHAAAMLTAAARCDLLVLDDVGVVKMTDWTAEQVLTILDTRYQRMLPTIITTNLRSDELKHHYVRGLTGRDGMAPEQAVLTVDRILDRIKDRCYPIELVGASRRGKGGSNWLSGVDQ